MKIPFSPKLLQVASEALAFLGGAFCLVIFILGRSGEEACFSNGCMLFSDFSLFGISLWTFGGSAFICLLLFPKLMVARFFLACDCVFLALMLMGLPCVNCMIAGTIFFLIFLCLAFPFSGKDMALGGIWLMLLVLNMGIFLSEFGDYAITKESSVRIYFSPSCAVCAEALDAHPSATLYPVAENKDDLAVIWTMKELLDRGETPIRALAMAKKAHSDAPFWLGMRLWKNKGRVLESGGVAPLIISNGFAAKKDDYIKNFSFGQ